MGDDLPEKLYMAWRSSLLSTVPDLPSWGNVRDPDVRAAWEAAAGTARREVKAQCAHELSRAVWQQDDADADGDPLVGAIVSISKQWKRGGE